MNRIGDFTKKSCLALLIPGLALLLGGCYYSNPRYPRTWAALGTEKDIESTIEGSFSCSGEIFTNEAALWPKHSLTGFLIGGKNPPSCERIEIRKLGTKELEMRFMTGDREVLRRTYRKDLDYTVKNRWIVLKSVESLSSDEIALAHESARPELTVNSERNLIVKAKTTMVGTVMVVIPAGTADTDWGLFKRIP